MSAVLFCPYSFFPSKTLNFIVSCLLSPRLLSQSVSPSQLKKPYFYLCMWCWNRVLPFGCTQEKENVGSFSFISLSSFQSLGSIIAFTFAEALVTTKGKEQPGPWLCSSDLASTGGTACSSSENVVIVLSDHTLVKEAVPGARCLNFRFSVDPWLNMPASTFLQFRLSH